MADDTRAQILDLIDTLIRSEPVFHETSAAGSRSRISFDTPYLVDLRERADELLSPPTFDYLEGVIEHAYGGTVEAMGDLDEGDEIIAILQLDTTYDVGEGEVEIQIAGLDLTFGAKEYTVRASAKLSPDQAHRLADQLRYAVRPREESS